MVLLPDLPAELEPCLKRCSMRGDEKRVIDAYVTWLERSNSTVRCEVDFVDVYAQRREERLLRRGQRRDHITTPGFDTLYGPSRGRMRDLKAGARYAVVVTRCRAE